MKVVHYLKKSLYDLQDFYLNSPRWVKKSLGYVGRYMPPRYLYGKEFIQTYKLLNESQYWTYEQHREFQFSNLKSLLQYAYDNVIYYKQLFDDIGFRPNEIGTPEDIRQIPSLTKKTIINNLDRLIARNIPYSDLHKVTTSGSTGNPMLFVMEKAKTRQREKAFIYQLWKRVGFDIGDKFAVLRGNLLKKNLWYDFDPISNYLILSPFKLDADSVNMYVKKLNEFHPDFLYVYPSTATLLANLMLKNNLKLKNKPKAVLCSSEKLYSWQRELLQNVFECRIFSWYGHSEYAVLAGECECSQDYHLFPEYGYTELIKADKSFITADQEIYEIVTTGFNNYALPFIRYKTGDYAILSQHEKCSCGRNYRLIKEVIGREQDFVVTAEKNLISLTSLIPAQHLKSFAKIEKIQVIQNEIGKIKILIIPLDNFTAKDEKEFGDRIQECVGNGNLKLDFEYVKEIPTTVTGKHVFLKQNLDLNNLK